MDIFDTIQHFVVILYCRTSELGSVNEARKQLFYRSSRTIKKNLLKQPSCNIASVPLIRADISVEMH